MCVKTGSGATTCEVVTAASQTFTAPGCGAAFVNADARGYYFTEYAPAAVAALAARTPAAHRRRADQPARRRVAARARRPPRRRHLPRSGRGLRDRSRPPPSSANWPRAWPTSHGAVADEAERPAYAAWIRRTFGPALTTLGVDPRPGDSDDTLSLRGTLVGLLGGPAGDDAVRARARALAIAYLDRPGSLPPTLIAPVLAVAASGGDAALYDRLLERLREAAETPDAYYRYFNALTAFRDPALVERTLAFALSDAVRSQDAPALIAPLLAGPRGDLAWAFVTREWEPLTEKLGVFQGVPAIVSGLGGFCTADRGREIAAFFKAHPVPAAARSLSQALERIDACVALDKQQSSAFATWLAKHGGEPDRRVANTDVDSAPLSRWSGRHHPRWTMRPRASRHLVSDIVIS